MGPGGSLDSAPPGATRRHSAPPSAPCTVATTAAWSVKRKASSWPPRARGPGGTQSADGSSTWSSGARLEVLPHRQAYTSTDEARALVASTPARCSRRLRSAPGPAMRWRSSRPHIDSICTPVREALGDHHARLASEEELDRDFPGYLLRALAPLGALLGSEVFIDPEVPGRPGGVRGRHPDRVGQDGGPGSCSPPSRSPLCRWSSRPTGAATT